MQCVNEKTPAPAVRKRPLWKRTNRGFVVSMVLLAAVIVYVVVSQLMLIPDKNAIRALADRVDEAYMSAITLSDEQLAAFTAALERLNASLAQNGRTGEKPRLIKKI